MKKPDPARIRTARKEGLRARLIGDGLLPEQADRWIATWLESEGDPDTVAFWEAAYEWIVSELAGGHRTPDATTAAVTTRATRGAGAG